MTREQAVEYDEKLSKELQDYAKSCGENESIARDIVDNFVEFLPEDDMKGMIFLKNAVSYKLGNAFINFKKAVIAGLEFAASVNRPESIFNYIQMLILSALFVRNAVRQELNGIEAYVVYLLHMKEAYQFSIEEEQFIRDLQECYMQREGAALEREKIVEAINHLYKIKVADFDDGKICLKEKVWGKLG